LYFFALCGLCLPVVGKTAKIKIDLEKENDPVKLKRVILQLMSALKLQAEQIESQANEIKELKKKFLSLLH
jgi:hypothetical protein